MALTGDSLLKTLTDSLSISDLEELLENKRNDGKPREMTEKQKWKSHYEKLILNNRILRLP